MKVFVDAACFPDLRDPIGDELRELCKTNRWPLFMESLPVSGQETYRNEVVAIAGLGVAILSLIVSLAQLVKKDRRVFTQHDIAAELDAFLMMRGIPNYSIIDSAGLENLKERNGRPARIDVSLPSGIRVSLYVGICDGKLIISPFRYDWRALT